MGKQIFFLLLFFFLFANNILAQEPNKTFNKLNKEALALFKAEAYTEAAQKYEELLSQTIELKEHKEFIRYETCLAWTLSNNKEKAFECLYQLIKEDYFTDFNKLSFDVRFKLLHADERWEDIKVGIKENINKTEALLPFYEGIRGEDFNLDELEKVHLPLDGEKACMIPFRESERYGFVSNNKEQKWLIKPTYKQVLAVTEEGAIVLGSGGRYSVVRPDGTDLVPPYWQHISKEGNLYHTISIGDCRFSPEGIPIKRFREDPIYTYCLNNHYYDTKGTLLFTEQTHDYQTFIGDDQLAWFRYGKRYRIRNKSGKLVKEFNYESHQNTFIGISDDLLIYSVTNEQDSTTYYVAKDLDGNVKFKLPTKYDSPTSFQGIHYNRSVRGVYQLSEQLYGIRYELDHSTPYSFCDASGNELEMKGSIRTLSTLEMDLDYFSREEFIVHCSDSWERKNSSMMVINRGGDTIIPQPILMGDTTIVNQYSKITRRGDGNYFCILRGSYRGYYFDKSGKLIKKKTASRLRNKIIPWSQEKLDAVKEAYSQRVVRYSPLESFYKMFELYSLNVPKNPTEDLIPVASDLIMPTDTTEDGKTIYTSVGISIYYINLEGEIVLELPEDVEFVGYFSEGLAPAMNKEKGLGFINLKGEWAIPPKYEITFVGGYPISLPDFPTFKGGYAYLRGFKGYIDKNGKEFFSGKRMQDHYNYSH